MKKIITDDYEFEHIIAGKAVYVDKTHLLARMASGRDGTQFFMSRPRRFGKSLMLTTLKAMFEGRRELFKGLKIEKTKWDWNKTYPVVMLNMSRIGGERDRSDPRTRLRRRLQVGCPARDPRRHQVRSDPPQHRPSEDRVTVSETSRWRPPGGLVRNFKRRYR